MEIAIFKEYSNGFYTFDLENIGTMIFDDVHPKVLYQYNLKDDAILIGQSFYLTFSEQFSGDTTIYMVQSLKKI